MEVGAKQTAGQDLIPGRDGRPAIAIEGPVKSGAPFIKAIELASE